MMMITSLARIMVVGLFLFCAASVFAAPQCLTGDCENGSGTMLFDDETRYTGEFNAGVPEGTGVFEYPKEKKLSVGDPIEMQGKTWQTAVPMGKKYSGEVKGGKREGNGSLEFYSGAVYTGQFKEDHLHGIGKMVNPNGVVYEGEFYMGQPNGKGKILFPDGKVYEGEVLRNSIDGKGVMTYPDGRREEGIFEKGRLKKSQE